MKTQVENIDQTIMSVATLISEAKFQAAEELLIQQVESDQLIGAIHTLAEEQIGILVYTFIQNRIKHQETSFWHRVAAVVLTESLQLPSGKVAAVYHLKKAIQLDPIVWEIKEALLSYYEDGLITEAEAKALAKDIIAHSPNNELAKKMLS